MDSNSPAKSLFIIKAKADSLVAAENWLRGKGWKVETTTSVKDALPKILEAKPNFIIVCMDHPNPKVRMLPKLFESAFSTKVIAYLETTGGASISLIAGMEYVLYPPISGTMIDRMASKIERDARRKQELEAQRSSGVGKASLGTSKDSVIAIKGENKVASDKVMISKKAQEKLSQLMQSESGTTASFSKDGGPSSSVRSARSGSPGELESSSEVSDADAAAALKSLMNAGNRGGTASGRNSSGSAASSDSSATEESSEVPNFSALQGSSGSPESGEDSDEQEKKKKLDSQGRTLGALERDYSKLEAAAEKASHKNEDSDEAAKEAANGKDKEKETKGGFLEGAKAAIRALANRGKTLTFRKKDSQIKENAEIVQNTQKAIEIAAEMDPATGLAPLKECTDLICFFVHSKEYHGYVLCAIASGNSPLSPFVAVFREKLIQFMGENGQEFFASEALDLRVQKVEFEEWAKFDAEFVKKFPHLGCECMVAYFTGELPPPKINPSVQIDMVSLHIDEVHGDRHLEFDLFLHLPKNKRFVRYGKKKRNLSQRQRSRLEARGVNTVHLPQKQINDLLRYRLQIFLDRKITQHKEIVQQRSAV